MNRIARLVLASLLSLSAVAESDPPQSPPAFEQLLSEASMTFTTAPGFQEIDLRANPLFTYDKAVANEYGTLEIRYAVRPLGRIQIDYEDPHSSAPDPNHMFPVMFQSMVTLLSDGRHSPTNEFPPTQARDRFNADWAAAAVFDMSDRFNADHKQALVIALHKNKIADAYSIFLFDDYEQARELINDNLNRLSFLP
jgi:hypothetical protein